MPYRINPAFLTKRCNFGYCSVQVAFIRRAEKRAEKPFDAAGGDDYLAIVNCNLNLNLLLNALRLCRAAVGF